MQRQQEAYIKVQSRIVSKGPAQAAENYRQESPGQFYQKGNHSYIRYQEQVAEGLAGSTVIWKLESQRAVLIRSGEVQLRQEFVPRETTQGYYETPYGRFAMQVRTAGYEWRIRPSEATARLDLRYEMELLKDISQIQIRLEVSWQSIGRNPQ